MDINFSAEDLAFRDEVRDFFATEFDAETAQQLEWRAECRLQASDC